MFGREDGNLVEDPLLNRRCILLSFAFKKGTNIMERMRLAPQTYAFVSGLKYEFFILRSRQNSTFRTQGQHLEGRLRY